MEVNIVGKTIGTAEDFDEIDGDILFFYLFKSDIIGNHYGVSVNYSTGIIECYDDKDNIADRFKVVKIEIANDFENTVLL